MDINPPLDLTTDCLRFVTEFFEVINQSAPHIYHSALQLAPQSSIVWKLYSHQTGSQTARIVTGIPSSWDSCTANIGVETMDCVWSPCGKFIAAGSAGSVTIRDSNTLEKLSTLKSPLAAAVIGPLAFSPDASLLAGTYSCIRAVR